MDFTTKTQLNISELNQVVESATTAIRQSDSNILSTSPARLYGESILATVDSAAGRTAEQSIL